MSFNINNFINKIASGGARPTLFDVTVTGPALVLDAEATRKMRFTCKAAQVPSMTKGLIELPYMGRKIKTPGDRVYNEWTVTVMNDEDFSVRNWLESWSIAINDPVLNTRIAANVGAIKGTANVIQYSKTGAKIAEYRLVGVYPQEVAAMDLSWESTDQVQDFQTTFQFDYFDRVGSDGETRDDNG